MTVTAALPATMRAVVLRRFGAPEVLQLEHVPAPTLVSGEVIVRTGAVTVNRSYDVKVREDGNARDVTLPLVLGADPSGEVVAVADDVGSLRPGDRVAVWRGASCGVCDRCQAGTEDDCLRKRLVGLQRWGGYAEFFSAPASTLQRIPHGLPFADASVIVRHFPTALALAFSRAGLKAGESVLVMGAAGALGSALVQVARQAGVRVIAAAGADERVAAAVALGADAGVNYRRQDLAAAARAFTDGRGVDVVFENIGDPSLWPGAFNSLRYGGRLATFGAHGGDGVHLDVRRLYGLRLSVLGGATVEREHLNQALEGAAAGRYRATIGAVLPLEQARRAHEIVQASQVIGKVVLDPNGLARQ
jgi:NADPH:quinone reductase-like Zn-dependent oxidoreductase